MLQDCKSQVEKKQLRKQISITQCFVLGMDVARNSEGQWLQTYTTADNELAICGISFFHPLLLNDL